jgi:glutamate--cysteine ligase
VVEGSASLVPQFAQRIDSLEREAGSPLAGRLLRGLEKESLRVTPTGQLAQTPHATLLGSALTHPSITTDYSEALIELITEPRGSAALVLQELSDIHAFVYRSIGDELLWNSSMPCPIGGDAEIPVARYGSSNVARMKTVYRIGLGHRYGRLMQTIAGIHYNFSLTDPFWEWLIEREGSTQTLRDFKTAQCFALIRNFHRYSWLLVYLFGASPALCSSFVRGGSHGLAPLGSGTLHAPYGTSLRMGDLGYQSDAQRSIDIPYDNLDEYVAALNRAIREPHPAYAAIGTQGKNGEWLQLSTSLLQIENEFYSTIRPKRVTRSGESPRRALAERGVEYVEVRCLDIDPFEPAGIATSTMRFLDAFLLYCLLANSPPSDGAARERSRENFRQVVMRGREPGLALARPDGSAVGLQAWALELLDGIDRIAAMLTDEEDGGYRAAAAQARARVMDPDLTPSARVLAALDGGKHAYADFALEQSRLHRNRFLDDSLPDGVLSGFERDALLSLEQQRLIESRDALSFDDYVAAYYRQ